MNRQKWFQRAQTWGIMFVIHQQPAYSPHYPSEPFIQPRHCMHNMHLQYMLVSNGLAGQKWAYKKVLQVYTQKYKYMSLEGTSVPKKGI